MYAGDLTDVAHTRAVATWRSKDTCDRRPTGCSRFYSFLGVAVAAQSCIVATAMQMHRAQAIVRAS